MTSLPQIQRIDQKAKKAGVKLYAPLAESDIVRFEESRGVTLPAEYRAFVQCLGNGGSGPPAYGLCGLGEVLSDFNWPAPDFSKPFPFTKAWVWEDGDVSAEGTKADVTHGILVLGTDGCGQYWTLVVNGPAAGQVWMLTDVGVTPLVPSMTLLQWYEAWLDGKRE
jgi:hypothetical protein